MSPRPDCIFEIHQLWQSGFSRVYFNSWCSCSFGPEILKIGQSSHKMYSNNIVNFQEFTTILNACTKRSVNLLNAVRIYTVKLAMVVEGDPKVSFSIATTPWCRGGRYYFPGLVHFTLDPYVIMLSVKQGSIKYHFLSLWYDSTWGWIQVLRAIGEHSNHYTNVQYRKVVNHKYI